MSRAKEEFENIPIINTIHRKLPFNEFEKGNFSDASKIYDVLDETIQELFKFFTREKLNHDSISEYITTEKGRVTDIQNHIKAQEAEIAQLEVRIKEKFKAFKQDNILLAQRNWKKLFDYLKSKKKGNFKTFKADLEEMFSNNEEQRERGEDDYKDFIACPYSIEIENMQNQIKEIKEEIKKEQKDRLYGTIDQYEKGLNTGGTHEYIKEEIRKEIYKFFGKRNIYQDTKNLKGLFMEKINNELILSPNTDPKLKKTLIKNHENKSELFFYMFEDLFMKSNIGRTRFVYNTQANILNIQEERKGKVEELFEYIQQKYDEGVSSRIFRDKEKDGFQPTISFLKEQLQSPKTFSITAYSEDTKEIKKAWNKLDSILEESEVRYEYERLRNFDYLKLAERKEDIKTSLEWIFVSMDPHERNSITNDYLDSPIMQEFFEECYHKYPQDIQTEILLEKERAE